MKNHEQQKIGKVEDYLWATNPSEIKQPNVLDYIIDDKDTLNK